MADHPPMDSGQALLRHAALRAAARPFFLASVLLPYAEAEGLDDAALAGQLGCPPTDLSRLLLCRRPNPDPPAFRSDVEQIATAFGLAALTLAEVIRRADALAALGQVDASGAEGWLAAARDREPDPDEESEQ